MNAPCAVHNGEVVLHQLSVPARESPGKVPLLMKVDQRVVVHAAGKGGSAIKVGPEFDGDGPHHCQEFAVRGGVVDLGSVERPRGESNGVLLAVVVQLCDVWAMVKSNRT